MQRRQASRPQEPLAHLRIRVNGFIIDGQRPEGRDHLPHPFQHCFLMTGCHVQPQVHVREPVGPPISIRAFQPGRPDERLPLHGIPEATQQLGVGVQGVALTRRAGSRFC